METKTKKIINSTNECVENCGNRYEYNGICYDNSKGFLYDDKNNSLNICKCELDKCLLCNNVSLNENLGIKCNDNYYLKKMIH